MIVVKVGYGRKRLEEHLLICSACRDRLESTDEYLAAMRSAANRGAAGGVAVAGDAVPYLVLTTDLEPIYVRLLPRFEAIRAAGSGVLPLPSRSAKRTFVRVPLLPQFNPTFPAIFLPHGRTMKHDADSGASSVGRRFHRRHRLGCGTAPRPKVERDMGHVDRRSCRHRRRDLRMAVSPGP